MHLHGSHDDVSAAGVPVPMADRGISFMIFRRSCGQRRVRLRPSAILLASGLMTVMLVAAMAIPASAAPPDPVGVPDPGSRPTPVGPLVLPGQIVSPAVAPSAANTTVAAQIDTKQVEYASTSQKLLALDIERSQVRQDRAAAESRLRQAQAAASAAQVDAPGAASAAFREAAALPAGQVGSPLHQVSGLLGLQRGDGSGSVAAVVRAVDQAREAERVVDAAYRAAAQREQEISAQYQQTRVLLKAHEAALKRLRDQNAGALDAIDQQSEARENALAPPQAAVAGKAAHPDALKAVRFALDQLGDPYVWAAEGPDSYDCSGLMWAAYRTVGRTLPRVSKDQYYGTRQRPVDRSALLPGDLVFFSSSTSWQDIYHVGMYIGGGKMVYAPTFNDVVKVGTVRWSSYFAATRVIGEVDAPKTSTTPTVPPSSSPTPSPRATVTSKPAPSRTPPSTTGPSAGAPSSSATAAVPSTAVPSSAMPTSVSPSRSGSAMPSVSASAALSSITAGLQATSTSGG